MSQSEIEQVQAAIAALEAQRSTLGDNVVETALAPLREKLEALTQPAETPDERKRITVLFADVSGYTAMSENLDPEDVTAIMNRLFETLTDTITRHGGTIDKFSGDAVMALFGAPEALEYHEEMAVRAALGMQTALAEFNTQLQRERGITLRLRIGLHTGEVLAGWVGGGDARSYTVMGDAVNLASRLEHACPVGRVMISADTARPLHAIFDFEPPRQITVKGKSEPITVYVVIGGKAERGRVRGIAGLTAPMVGRDKALAQLRNSFKRAMAEAPWQAATIVGEAGIGKTRLKREFVGWAADAQPNIRVLSARSYTHTQATPYYLVSRLIRGLFDMGEDVDQTTIDRMNDTLHRLEPNLDDIEYRYQLGSLAGVLGLSLDDNPLDGLDPEQRRDRTFLSLERILLRASEQMPLLIVLDDLHWADTMSVAFLERLLQTIARGPSGERGTQRAMLLMLSRPAEREYASFAAVLDAMGEEPHISVELERLDTDQSGTLVSALLDQELPADLLHLVVDHAQGNPFFVEEILRSLIEDEVLVEDDAGWHVTHPIADIEVPGTIQDVLAARLDRLPFQEKQILQYAAIIGRTFWQELLTEIYNADTESPDIPISNVESTLAQLEQRHFVARLTESQLAHDWEWTFEHVLIQEVAYSGVLKKVRRRVHREIATQLETRLSERTSFLIPHVAYHYERGDAPAKAVTYLQKAGGQAAEQYANEDAVQYYTRALTLLEDSGMAEGEERTVRYALLLGRESVYGLMGRREEQVDDLHAIHELAEEDDDQTKIATWALRKASYCEAVSDFAAAQDAAQRATDAAARAGDTILETKGVIASANALWRQGELNAARRQLEKALELSRSDNNKRNEATSLHYLGTVFYFLGENDAAQQNLEQALTIRQAVEDRKGVATTLSNLIAIYHERGNLVRAKQYGEQALSIVRTTGNRWSEAYSLMNLGNIYHALGNLGKARTLLFDALDLFSTVGDRSGEAMAAENLSVVLHDLGNYDEAARLCRTALSIEQEIGDERGEAYGWNHLGLALEGVNELDSAHEAFSRALAIRRELGQEAEAMDDIAGLARIALAQHRLSDARSYAAQALAWIEENGVEGIEYPIRVYLTCADVLRSSNNHSRANEVLVAAHDLLQQHAEQIDEEETLQTFLDGIPLHRELRQRMPATDA